MKITLTVILLFLVIALLAWANKSYVASNQAMRNEMLSATVTGQPATAPIDETLLPGPVRRWLKTSGALKPGKPDWISIRQELTLKLTTEQQEGYAATADQLVTLNPPAFHWAVRVRMNALMPVYGWDSFTRHTASTHMKLWGLWSVASIDDNPKANEAALQRFLAEMVWYPRAALEPYVSWEEIDSLSSMATITLEGLTGSGIFHFTEEGTVSQFVAQRYQESGPAAERLEWVVDMEHNDWLAGIRVPLRAKITWQQPSGPWTWLHLKVKGLTYHAADPNPSSLTPITSD